MADHRLFEALTQFNPEDVARLYGDEYRLRPPDPTLTLAPVKRVAIFTESFVPKVDGVSKTAFLTLRYLQQTGREVMVFAPDTAPPYIGSSQVIALPSLGLPAAPETRVALPHPAIVNRLEAFQPDLIHLFSPAVLCVSGMLTGRLRGVPIIANYQTDLPAYANHYGYPLLSQPVRDWLRYIHNGCHLTLAPSLFTISQLRSWGYHRLRRWGRGVNSERFNPMQYDPEWRARLLNGRDPDSLICIYVGRLANEKRVDLLLEVAKLPGVALTIIGDGAKRNELESLFAGTNTHFMGYLYGEELAHAYASADVFTFTGGAETFGQVVQEAMASGLPTVVINQGGVTDLVVDGVTGYTCEDHPRDFAEAVAKLRDNPRLRRSLGRNARRMAEQSPWETVLAQLEDHYTEAVALNLRVKRVYPSPMSNLTTLFHWGVHRN